MSCRSALLLLPVMVSASGGRAAGGGGAGARVRGNRGLSMPLARPGERDAAAGRAVARPRLGVLATHPIQYQAPLYQELARRGVVELEVAFLSSGGAQPVRDPSFGVTLAWDIDVLGGYQSTVLARKPLAAKAPWLLALSRWLRRQDIAVLHGHADPDMLLAAAMCRP